MTDRIVGLFLLAISIWYGVTAGDYEASFGDPLGPAGLSDHAVRACGHPQPDDDRQAG